jgi:IclR family pca regulon transcriptional regulator
MPHMQAKQPRSGQAVPGTTRPAAAALTRSAAQPAAIAEIDALTGDPNFMTSLARGLAVIRAFSEQRRRLTIAQISQRTGIPRAAVRRCLYTLAKLGYVESEANAYALRPKLLSLGHAYLSSTPLAVSAQPLLDRVTSELHESCSLAILDGDEILYLARSAASRIMSVSLNVGSRLPAYCTSLGRVLLAHLPQAQLEEYIVRAKLMPLTERTVVSRPKLRQLLEATRHSGYSIVDQEMEIGLRSIAVPVRDASGGVPAAINVSAQAPRVGVRRMESEFLPPLQAAARDLGAILPR